MNKTWWKEAVVYQIYPRSFNDSNGDGIGDLRGILQKVDYLHTLGVNVIWMSPHYPSPNVDNGYDISDYTGIMPEFGSMEDFEELLHALHARQMYLVIDLVVNHSSDQHEWFKEARKSKKNKYRDYYIWKSPQENGAPPNNWRSLFSGSAWTLDDKTGEYYLHLFTKEQPDLNWENPKLREEVYSLMRFWLDKGVDGFRMDVIPLISKDLSFPNRAEADVENMALYATGPRLHEFLQEMNREVLSHYDCMTVGEALGVSTEEALRYIGEKRKELQSIYHFDHAVGPHEKQFADGYTEHTLLELKATFEKWDTATATDGWNTIYFGNHDNPRVLSRFGDTGSLRTESGKMIATILLTHRGTPYIYQGDELGMSNFDFKEVAAYNDVQVKNAHRELVEKQGMDENTFLRNANIISRDHARTPMQWKNALHAGFTTGNPWLEANPNYTQVNAFSALTDGNSIFHFYRKLIALRKSSAALVYGKYEDVLPNHRSIWAYTRTFEGEQFLIVLNFYDKPLTFDLPQIQDKKPPLSNYNNNERNYLNPYESRVYKMT